MALAWSLPATRDGEEGTKPSRAISITQLFPAAPGRLLVQGHTGRVSAEAYGGQRPELALALSPQHLRPCHCHGKCPGQGDVKGWRAWAGETQQREAAFRLWLFQMLQLINENNSE